MNPKFRRKYNLSFRNRFLKEQEDTPGGSVESPSPTSDVEKLTGALSKEREQRAAAEKQAKQFQKQLEAFSGVDPELARKANEILQQSQQWEEREAKLRADVDGQYRPKLDEYDRQVKAYEQKLSESQSALLNYRRDSVLEREFGKAGGFEGEFEAVASALRGRTRLNPESGELEVLGEDGKRLYSKDDPSKPATVGQLIQQLQKEQLWFSRHFKGYESGGAGINGNGRGGSGDPNWEKLPAWEKVSRMREQNKS